jgi:hypothetical protein
MASRTTTSHWKAVQGFRPSAQGLREIAETCDWISRLSVTAPLEITPFAGGPQIRLSAPAGRQLVYTDGTITARSGTTAGTGNVFLCSTAVASGVCTITNTTNTLTVFNFSASTGGIPTGKYCWLDYDIYGTPFIVSAEC